MTFPVSKEYLDAIDEILTEAGDRAGFLEDLSECFKEEGMEDTAEYVKQFSVELAELYTKYFRPWRVVRESLQAYQEALE